jgi:hypothetical protein
VIQERLGHGWGKRDNGTSGWRVMGKGRLRFGFGFGVRIRNLNETNGVYSQGWKLRGGQTQVKVRENGGTGFRGGRNRRNRREGRRKRDKNSSEIRGTWGTNASNTGETRGAGRGFQRFLRGVYYRGNGFGFTFGTRMKKGGRGHGRHGRKRDDERIRKGLRDGFRNKDWGRHGQDGGGRRRFGVYYCRSRFGFTNGKGNENFR